MMGYLLARFHRRRWVLEVVDVWPDVPIGMGIIKKRWLQKILHSGVAFLYRKADRIVALSKGMKQQIMNHPIDPRKIVVSPNCTNTELFHPLNEEKQNPLPIILYAGAIGKANDVLSLLRAVKHLENDCVVHIYGWGAELSHTKIFARMLMLNNVFFFDPLPKKELAEKMRQADIGVITFAPFPVLEANSANKFFDYLASGLPVVINYQGWQAEYLAEYECGLSVPQGKVKALAEALDQLLADENLRKKMGINARQLAKAWFDRADEAEKLLFLLKETVSDTMML
jgi:glycosyltransferase involved in cell wall biosynthesis